MNRRRKRGKRKEPSISSPAEGGKDKLSKMRKVNGLALELQREKKNRKRRKKAELAAREGEEKKNEIKAL